MCNFDQLCRLRAGYQRPFCRKASAKIPLGFSLGMFRSEREKSDIAPLFVPRDRAGYLIVTCPKCLRPNRLEAMSLNGGIHQTICQSCGTPVRFEINPEIEPLMKRKRA
jgi:hypothetical protein